MAIEAIDIARAIGRPGDDPIKNLNRVRNWTRFGLLKPIEDASGRAFKYDESAKLDAALIAELANIGISTNEIGPLLEHLKGSSPELFAPEFFKSKAKRTLLVLSRTHGGNVWNVSLRTPEELARYCARHLCSQYVIIDLENLRELLMGAAAA
jgi:hypothetical protein